MVTSAFSWFISFITLSLVLRSVTMTLPAGWCWINCERSKQATARALGSLDVSKIVMRTLRICIRRHISTAVVPYFKRNNKKKTIINILVLFCSGVVMILMHIFPAFKSHGTKPIIQSI